MYRNVNVTYSKTQYCTNVYEFYLLILMKSVEFFVEVSNEHSYHHFNFIFNSISVTLTGAIVNVNQHALIQN